MADVFRAQRHGAEGFVKTVAIKRILPHLMDNEEFVGMFTDEARIAASLDHANIVSIHDFGRVDGQLFLVMELVEGTSLTPILNRLHKQHRPMPLRHALYIILEVCKGLHAAHSRRVDGVAAPVIHRDISPQNILVSYNGEVKITDFGVAKAQGRVTVTQADTLKGKISYMSPEQASGEAVDPRSDIFSVGILFFELLTGTRLFKGQHQAETLMKVLNMKIDPPSMIRRSLPPEIDAFVLKALERDRSKRYQKIAALGRDISQFLITTRLDASSMGFAEFVHEVVPEVRSQEEPGVTDTASLGDILATLDSSPTRPARPGRTPEAGGDRQTVVTEVKDLAGHVQSRSDVDLWVQLALLARLSLLETNSPKRAKLIDALIAAANGHFASQKNIGDET